MIRKAEFRDTGQIVSLFSALIREHPSYISHGEIQMGIAEGPDLLSAGFEKQWEHYLSSNMQEFPEGVLVWENEKEEIRGFAIFRTETDLYKPFGVICDLCVEKDERNKGIGSELLHAALEQLMALGITDFYLESGLHNRSAHAFFEKKGFLPVSKIFRKKT